MANNVVSPQKINEAAGNNTALREILEQVSQTTQLTTGVTSTAPGKPVPTQGKATVSFLENNYIVQIQNPGAIAPLSALQSAQATQGQTVASNTQNVQPIYYQIRVANSPQFNISSNVQTFGGDTGSTQTYWTLTGLGSGRFYFQIRSSYDGVNWNLWRNANGGQTITKGIEGVTLAPANNSVWGEFTLPGDQLVAFGAGFVANGGSFGLPTGLYTSAMQVIPGPNGVAQTSNDSHGIQANEIAIQTPTEPQSLIGPADYPTLISELYQDGEGNVWSGSANIWGFAFDPLGSNVTLVQSPQGNWAIFTLPGGAQMAVGSGTMNDGDVLAPPSPISTWFNVNNMLSVVSPQNAFSDGNHAHGVGFAGFNLNTPAANPAQLRCYFQDGEGHQWGGASNWFAICFSSGVVEEVVPGGKFLTFYLPTGTKVAIGAGNTASGTPIQLPPGFTAKQTLTFGTPASFNDAGQPMTGVGSCEINNLVPNLSYTNGGGTNWGGNVAWMCFAWQ